MKIIDRVGSPSDVKKLVRAQLDELAAELREEIVSVVLSNGGHLSSNLGVVEIVVAMHRVSSQAGVRRSRRCAVWADFPAFRKGKRAYMTVQTPVMRRRPSRCFAASRALAPTVKSSRSSATAR